MEIRPPLPLDQLVRGLTAARNDPAAVRQLLTTLAAGQTLQARVLSAPRADLAQLLIDGLTITARTGRPLQVGQQLELTVLRGGSTPELQIREQPQPPRLPDLLRRALPRQMPLAETLRQWPEVAARALPLLSGDARQALKALLQRDKPLPPPDAGQLRKAVSDSGLFTETRLARGQAPAPSDRKVLLLQLAAALPARPATATGGTTATAGASPPTASIALARALGLGSLETATMRTDAAAPSGTTPLTPEQQTLDRLWRLVEASLARLQLHQAAAVPRDEAPVPAFQLEIPIAVPGGPTEVIDLRIRRDGRGQDPEGSEDAGWLVTVGFSFARLGPVTAAIRLAQTQISTSFWCEQAATVLLFKNNLAHLQRSLEAAGLQVGPVSVSQGSPPPADQRPGHHLLDERV